MSESSRRPRRRIRSLVALALSTALVGAVPVVSASAASVVPTVTVASDGFSRVVAGGLGSADVGGAWVTAGRSADFAVNGGAGRLRLSSPGESLSAVLGSVAVSDVDVAGTVSFDKVASGGGAYVALVGRAVAGVDTYRVRVKVAANGATTLQLQRGEVTLQSMSLAGLSYVAGEPLRLEMSVSGTSPTTLRAKAWTLGSVEPTSWMLSASDATAGMQTAGGIGVWTYLSGTAANAPVTVAVDDLTAAGVAPTLVTKTAVPNRAPSAVEGVTVAGLSVTADGSGSSDPDGTVVGYAWTFGDGAGATGVAPVHTYAASGTYTVGLTVTDNDGATATTTSLVSVTALPGEVRPSGVSTGVPVGTVLRAYHGDLVITTPGTVIDSLDVFGFVTIKAANVTIKNSRVRGSGPGSTNTGLINCTSAAVVNAVIQDVTLVPDYPSVWLDGVIGHDFTATRVNTSGVVDGFGVYNTGGPAANVTIASSWVHDLSYFSPDPNHPDNQTHNDAIQIQGGSNIQVVGNELDAYLSTSVGTQNYPYPQAGFGVIVTPNVSPVTGSRIDHNWITGSYIPIKLTTGTWGATTFGEVNDNRFAHDMRNVPMGGVNQWFTILMTPDTTATTTGDVYDDTGTPVTVRHDSGTTTAP